MPSARRKTLRWGSDLVSRVASTRESRLPLHTTLPLGWICGKTHFPSQAQIWATATYHTTAEALLGNPRRPHHPSSPSICAPVVLRPVCNLLPLVAKTLSFRKPFGTKSTTTSHTSLYDTHSFPRILCSATTLQHMFCSLIVCKEGRSWQARRARNNDEFCALSGKSRCDISHTATDILKHSLRCPLACSLQSDLFFAPMHAI
jgi:hypothetical protein